jgi:hypothetical protein
MLALFPQPNVLDVMKMSDVCVCFFDWRECKSCEEQIQKNIVREEE